jgi:hypothetical protein
MYKYFIAIFGTIINITSIAAQNRSIWDGELATDTCQNEWGRTTDSVYHVGNRSFMGLPDPWHSPGIKLRCTPSWRVNLSIFDEIRFWVKANRNANKPLNISIYGWPNVSRGIDVTPYLVGGGVVDTTWKQVRVPIDSLKTANFQLGVAEIIYFSVPSPPSGYRFFIDDVWAHDIKPTRITEQKIISNRALRLSIADRYDTTAVKNLSNYSLTSADDADFATPQYPSHIGMHYYVEDYDPSDNYNNPIPILNLQLFLQWAKNLKNGKTYTLTVNNVRDLAGNDFVTPYTNTFIFNDLQAITGSVKANHVGYLPNRPKYGYIGNFMGANENDVLVMPIDAPPIFEIRDANTHQTVFTGTATLRRTVATYNCNATIAVEDPTVDKRWAGEKVYSCDFTNFQTAGSYYLYSNGFGRSYTFRIASNVYDEAYRTVIRSLYLNRCGIELAPQYAGQFARPICHTSDGVIHSSQTASPLYGGEVVGSAHSCTRGWHDAGDYGKYVASAAQPVHDLLTAYEMYPHKFPDGFNNIPESGNGIPDVLDEVKWELDWLLSMQAPDGGVFFKIVTTNYATAMPHLDTPTRWLTEKTTHATAMACAMYAAGARVYRPFFPVYADTCLARAWRAWAWLEAHPNTYPTTGFRNPAGIGGGEYGDPGAISDVDERAWAAAELYKVTGDTAIHSRFLYFWLQNNANYGWNQFQHNQLKATWAYCTTTFPTNATYINSYKNSVRIGIEQYEIPRLEQTTYRCSHRPEVLLWIAWGSYGISTRYAWSQIKASYLLGRDYYNAAAINLDVQLGNNPQNRSYLTGIGYDYPRDPLHTPSNTDGIAEPLPGLTVFGPHANLGGLGYAGATQNVHNLYPRGNWECSAYPSLRRYYDVGENIAMSEPTRQDEATTAAVLAFFSSQNVVLPIEILDFQGIVKNEGNFLSWKIGDMDEVESILLEKSENGKDFTPLSTLSKNQDFYLDKNPFPITYYRLKIKDLGGKVIYSKIISLQNLKAPFGFLEVIKIYPNPVSDILTVENLDNANNIEIVNILGQTVLYFPKLNDHTIHISSLESGVYFLKMGGNIFKFIKK